jgi:hypothetical protein
MCVLMTMLDLVVQIFSDDYPAHYMVDYVEMREASRRGGVFNNVVGIIEPEDETNLSNGPFLEEDKTLGAWTVSRIVSQQTEQRRVTYEMASSTVDPRASFTTLAMQFPPLKSCGRRLGQPQDCFLWVPSCSLPRLQPDLFRRHTIWDHRSAECTWVIICLFVIGTVFTAILYALGGYGKDEPGAVIKSAIVFWYIGMFGGGAVGCLNSGRTLIEI